MLIAGSQSLTKVIADTMLTCPVAPLLSLYTPVEGLVISQVARKVEGLKSSDLSEITASFSKRGECTLAVVETQPLD